MRVESGMFDESDLVEMSIVRKVLRTCPFGILLEERGTYMSPVISITISSINKPYNRILQIVDVVRVFRFDPVV